MMTPVFGSISTLYIALIGVVVLVITVVAFLLRRSDAGIITSRYGRILRVFAGSARMSLRLWRRKLGNLFVSKERREELDHAYREETAKQAFETMGNMKGGFMKLGQIISFMDDALPEGYSEQLRQLQASAPPMPYETVVRVIREELGKDPEELFSDFDPEPLAAASIGQVHRARLRDGTDVVVKIQYPGVDDAIAADLGNMGMLLTVVGAALPHADIEPLVEELRDRMLEELDYVNEAKNQQYFTELFEGHPRIVIPAVFPELSTRRVLTSEFIDGQSFYDFIESSTPERRRDAVIAIYRFAFDSIWLNLCFNGDPHPGNYLFLEDGRVAFLDFGCVKHFDPEWMSAFREMVRLYLEGERQQYWEKAREIGIIREGHEDRVDVDWWWEYAKWFYTPILKDEPFKFTTEYCRQALDKVFGENVKKVNMPAEYLMMNRISFGVNSILNQLGAHENFQRLARHYYYDDAPKPPPDG